MNKKSKNINKKRKIKNKTIKKIITKLEEPFIIWIKIKQNTQN
jgi:prophage tail gpP-like protein